MNLAHALQAVLLTADTAVRLKAGSRGFVVGQANASTWFFRVRIIRLVFILIHLSPALYNLSN